jgi:hypothetical protein
MSWAILQFTQAQRVLGRRCSDKIQISLKKGAHNKTGAILCSGFESELSILKTPNPIKTGPTLKTCQWEGLLQCRGTG